MFLPLGTQICAQTKISQERHEAKEERLRVMAMAVPWLGRRQSKKKSKHARRFEDGSKTGAQFDHVAKNLWVGELQDTV